MRVRLAIVVHQLKGTAEMLSDLFRQASLILSLIAGSALAAYGQASPPPLPPQEDVRELQPAQTLEREVTNWAVHRYKISLRKNEFFQVRVEPKGLNITIKLSNADGAQVAFMSTPHITYVPLILSYIETKSGSYMLEVSALYGTQGRVNYSIKREAARTAIEEDKRRVEVERMYAEAIKTAFYLEDEAIAKLPEVERRGRALPDAYVADLALMEISALKQNKALSKFNNALNTYYSGSASSYRQALSLFQEAANAFRDFGGKRDEANSLLWAGTIAGDLGEGPTALKLLEQALKLFREAWDKTNESMTLAQIARVYASLGEFQKALEHNDQAIELYRAINDKNGEARTLISLGSLHSMAGKRAEALDNYGKALTMFRLSGDKLGEAMTLRYIGGAYEFWGEREKALNHYQQSLLLYKSAGDQAGEATLLLHLGGFYDAGGDKQKALEYFNQALPLYKAISASSGITRINHTTGDLRGEAAKLYNIGLMYSSQGDKQTALDFFHQSLLLYQTLGDKTSQAFAANIIGNTYYSIGNRDKALNYYNDALKLHQDAGNKKWEASTLVNIGGIHYLLGDLQKALGYLKQALPLIRSAPIDRTSEARTLSQMGSVYLAMGEREKSLQYYMEALTSARAGGDRSGESSIMSNVANVYLATGDKQKAIEFATQALPIIKAFGDKSEDASAFFTLTRVMESLGNRRMAIFYGKLSVNQLQELRRGLDLDIHKSLLRTMRFNYQRLAELLIEEGQLDQAVQVLNLYQDQQFFDFNRAPDAIVKPLALSPREKRSEDEINKVEQLGSRLADLKRRIGGRQPTQQEATNLAELEARVKTASDKLVSHLSETATEFSKARDSEDSVPPIEEVTRLQTALSDISRDTKQQTVALYTLIGDNHFRLLIVSPDRITAAAAPVRPEDFERKVLEFYGLLQSPVYDPRVVGKELYDIIIGPAEPELRRQKAQALVWSLTGTLRYVPMAALWDGERYLVERYQNVAFTRADPERMTRAVSPVWTGVGFGSSKEQQLRVYWGLGGSIMSGDFSALPGVTLELASIFGLRPNTNAILSGEVFADDLFTKNAFYGALKKRHPVVHISSHFIFSPGDEFNSYLLLGKNDYISLLELKGAKEKIFEGVELLTLSACNTAAAQPDATGKEIDGFAELAQRLGADAVMATLWQVSDSSTPWLMTEFYRTKRFEAGVTKSEALQRSQLSLIRGTADTKIFSYAQKGGGISNVKVVVVPEASRQSSDATRSKIVYVSAKNAPLFKTEDKKPFMHPYYWSPFVLFGNWR